MTQPPSPDPFEFLKMLWGPMGMPMPGMVTPTLNVVEIDKRLAELKSVETWLSMNLNVLKMTIQAMEMQRATLAAMQGMQAAGAEAVRAGAEAVRSRTEPPPRAAAGAGPLVDAWWNVLQQTQPSPGNDSSAKK